MIADEATMNRPKKGTRPLQWGEQRSVFRIPMIAREPVYLLLTMDGVNVDPVIDELGGGGARLVCAKHFDSFFEGQAIGPAVLVLPDEGMPVVYPVVRWKNWPAVGVEFVDISDKDREMILRFLFKVERRMPQSRPAKAIRRNRK
jgi:c-di-GMP-binding flagellar brake protein YcgR